MHTHTHTHIYIYILLFLILLKLNNQRSLDINFLFKPLSLLKTFTLWLQRDSKMATELLAFDCHLISPVWSFLDLHS